MAWSARPAMPAGHKVTATDMDAVLDQIELSASSWIAWTPTLTNLTLGNGSVSALYKQVGATVHYRFQFTLGSTSAVGTSPRFTLPVAPLSGYANFPLGDIDFTDAGTANRRGIVRLVSSSTVEIVGYGTTGVAVTVTSTVPHTWATSDTISCVGTYETT